MDIKRIVVATDFSPQSDLAAAHAIHIARHTGAVVVFVHAGVSEAHLDARLERRLLEEQARTYAASVVPVSFTTVEQAPHSGIPTIARELRADVIVLGTRGHTGIRRLLTGSVAEYVVRRTSSALVARGGAGTEGGYRRILVPTDFSEAADRALDAALALVATSGRIDLLHVWHVPGELAGYRGVLSATDPLSDPICRGFVESAINLGKERVELAAARQVHATFLYREGAAAVQIFAALEARRYDLVAMGSQGRRGLGRWLLGSVAETIVRNAPCSVLVTHNSRTSQPAASVEPGSPEATPPAGAGS